MSEGIIDKLGLEVIEKEIKSLITEIGNAQNYLEGLSTKVAELFNDAVKSVKELKAATTFTELNAATKTAVENTNKYADANSELAKMQKTVIDLTAKLSGMENNEAVAIQKLRLEIQEKNKENKIAAQQQIAATKAMNDYSSVLTKSAKSVNELNQRPNTNDQIPTTKYQIPTTKYQRPTTRYQRLTTKYQQLNTQKRAKPYFLYYKKCCSGKVA
jgi:chromosome segregation ATPase